MADLTYVAPDAGWHDWASREDLVTRQIVSGAARMTPDVVLMALDRAVARHHPPTGVLLHSAQGSPYAASASQRVMA